MNPSHSNYPRPRLRRSSWIDLNGDWEFARTKSSQFLHGFSTTITVPFCVESSASGLGWRVEADDFLHYHRQFSVHHDKNERVLLHFQAVDQAIDIYLNHQPASTAATVEDLVTDFNALLTKLKATGIMVEDTP